MTRLIATADDIKRIIRDYSPWQAQPEEFNPNMSTQSFDSEMDGTTLRLHAADTGAPEDDRWFVIVHPGYGADRYLVYISKEEYDDVRGLLLQNVTGSKLTPIPPSRWKKSPRWRKRIRSRKCRTRR